MKTVIITGGSRGIGRACALTFAEKGYRVYFCYSSPNSDVSSMCQNSDLLIPAVVDVTDETQVSNFIEAVAAQTGKIDTVICNAGISHWGLFTDTTGGEWDKVFSVNVKGVFHTAKYAAKQMIKQQHGSIITISSVWGQTGASCEAVYSASKAAVIGFTKAIAKELAPSGITANCICPGMINTDMNNRFTQDELQDIVGEIPLMRMGTPEEVAQSVLYLSEAEYITGQVLCPNGGMYI